MACVGRGLEKKRVHEVVCGGEIHGKKGGGEEGEGMHVEDGYITGHT